MNEDEESQSRTEEESESETTAVGGMEAWMEQEQSVICMLLCMAEFDNSLS